MNWYGLTHTWNIKGFRLNGVSRGGAYVRTGGHTRSSGNRWHSSSRVDVNSGIGFRSEW